MFDSTVFLKQTPSLPGVYLMYDKQRQILYIGKAKNLKKRLSSYFQKKITDSKTKQLVSHIHEIETIITSSENEAFILENNLIKKHIPKYNIVFRDDKSYPYLFISDEDYPRMVYHRGTKKGKGQYFGPYPNSAVVKETLNLLQKIFRIRFCNNAFFNSRKRPCLQYQIRRCSAPCVNLISKNDYQEDVAHVCDFLNGKSEEVIDQIIKKMNESSGKMEYEKAAKYRDQIQFIREMQSKQHVLKEKGDWDIVALVQKQQVICVNLMMVRKGQLLGNKSFIVDANITENASSILESFILQYYLDSEQTFPKQIILSEKIDHRSFLEKILSKQASVKVKIIYQARGDKTNLMALSKKNAAAYLERQLTSKATWIQRFKEFGNAVFFNKVPHRIECFDVSHTAGKEIVASCVVFNQDGAVKNDYRRFNITDITPGDDFAALKQALKRRFESLKKKESVFPDIVIIDGGKGQLKQAEDVLKELQIENIVLLAIAKGKARKPGKETIFLSGKYKPLSIKSDSIAFHLIQNIRDEAHRFAVAGHRMQRGKKQTQSILETIEGVGKKRRQLLLRHFGGLQGLKKASSQDIAQVEGISVALAEKIYTALRG